MSVWFEGENEIDCTVRDVVEAVDDLGKFYGGVVSGMPGLTSVEVVEQTKDSVTIKTNEGLMQRSNISKTIEPDRVVVELEEVYQAGSKVTTSSHFTDEFVASGTGVTHRLVISDVAAPGLLGFLYRRFGSSKTGNAFLAANQAYLETAPD